MHDILFEKTVQSMLKRSRPANQRKKRSIGEQSVFWPTGKTLEISFCGAAEDSLKYTIVETACEWLAYANLKFRLVENDDPNANIRIDTFVPSKVNNSMLGIDADSEDGPSMSLGTKPDDDKFRRIVLHEFGHALGMEHEHQHPQADIPWDFEALREHLRPKLEPIADADEDIEMLIDEAIAHNYMPLPLTDRLTLDYDPTSIMHYPVPQELTLGDWELTRDDNEYLSEKDKAFMRLAYPGLAVAT